jgi:hypothetical protein
MTNSVIKIVFRFSYVNVSSQDESITLPLCSTGP